MISADFPDRTAILRRLEQWHTDHRDELATGGMTARLRYSPPEWPKSSLSLELECGSRLSQLTVWDSGETELDLADIETNVHLPQHQLIDSPNDLHDLLNQQLAWLEHRPPST